MLKPCAKILLIVSMLSIGVSAARADEIASAQALFYQANASYAEEKFDQAIAAYEEALKLDYESGPLYYNLANAYFKQGILGEAIVNYLRAQRLMPDDADLKANLAYAQSLIKGGRVTAQRHWLADQLLTLAGEFNLDKITVLTVFLYVAAALFTVLFIFFKRARRILGYFTAASLAALLIATSLWGIQFYNTVVYKKAVIVVANAECKFEPFADATTFFMLSEGESVIVGPAKKEWFKIKRADAKQGWIKKTDIELL